MQQDDSYMLRQPGSFTVSSALKFVGGFGRFQVLAIICLTIMRNAGNYLFYGFGYLTLQQTYICKAGDSDIWGHCTQQVICENVATNFEFAVDKSDPDHIENWVQEMGIQCTNRSQISILMTSYCLVSAFTGLLLSSLPDKLGRRTTMFYFVLANQMSQFLLIFWPNYWARLAGFVIMGATTIKNTTSYVWLFDLVELKHK